MTLTLVINFFSRLKIGLEALEIYIQSRKKIDTCIVGTHTHPLQSRKKIEHSKSALSRSPFPSL